jgi:hypothetical protein
VRIRVCPRLGWAVVDRPGISSGDISAAADSERGAGLCVAEGWRLLNGVGGSAWGQVQGDAFFHRRMEVGGGPHSSHSGVFCCEVLAGSGRDGTLCERAQLDRVRDGGGEIGGRRSSSCVGGRKVGRLSINSVV